MRATYAVHILAGSVALLSGFVALYVTKGATVHRKSGRLFVCAMLVMAALGAVIAALKGSEGSVIAGVMTCYLVITGLTTVRRPAWWSPQLDAGLMSWALWIATSSFFLGQAKVIPEPIRIPALLAVPVVLVAGSMLYWLWRVRIRRSFRGIVGVTTPETIRLTGRSDAAITVHS